MGETRPPHPGAPPDAFEFPFAEAAAARRATQDLADELRTLRHVHADARDRVEAGVFEGRTATRFRMRFDQLMDDLERHVRVLDAQAEQIDDDIRQAHRRQQAYEAAFLRWRVAKDAWAEWRPPTTTSSR